MVRRSAFRRLEEGMTFSIADDFAQAFDDLGEFLRRDPPEAFSNPLYGQRPDLEGFAKTRLEALQKEGYTRCMSTTAYRRRIVDQELRSRLESAGAVVIEGPKACGKTATAETMAASEVRLDIDA
jgi:hypothetical protein